MSVIYFYFFSRKYNRYFDVLSLIDYIGDKFVYTCLKFLRQRKGYYIISVCEALFGKTGRYIFI